MLSVERHSATYDVEVVLNMAPETFLRVLGP